MNDQNSDQPDETLDEVIRDEDAPSTSEVPNPSTGGIVSASHSAGENSEAEVGDLGHPGIDEGTE